MAHRTNSSDCFFGVALPVSYMYVVTPSRVFLLHACLPVRLRALQSSVKVNEIELTCSLPAIFHNRGVTAIFHVKMVVSIFRLLSSRLVSNVRAPHRIPYFVASFRFGPPSSFSLGRES